MVGIRVCIISIFLTVLYVAGSVGLTNLLFQNQSNGSLIKKDGEIVGSRLLGQNFTENKYFHGRPSFYNYKNDISGSSQFSFYSKDLIKFTQEKYNKFTLKSKNSKVDLNLITESASGLDPHITYNGALSQTDRISKDRNIKKEIIIELINKNSKPRILGLFGDKIINVLELNLKLKGLYAKTSGSWWNIKANS